MTGVADVRGTTGGDSQRRATSALVGPSAPATSDAASNVTRDRDGIAALDDAADGHDERVDSLARAVSVRAQMILLRQQSIQQDLQLKVDAMRARFNAAQEIRAERMREMNALRDMAIEQGKKDDEVLKKFIAMI